MIDLIVGIIFIVCLGVFAIAACIISSGCCRYEGYERDKKNEKSK